MEASYLYAACHHALSHTQQDKNKRHMWCKVTLPVTRAEDACRTVNQGGTPTADILLAGAGYFQFISIY